MRFLSHFTAKITNLKIKELNDNLVSSSLKFLMLPNILVVSIAGAWWHTLLILALMKLRQEDCLRIPDQL